MINTTSDIMWVALASVLVFLMQAGFLTLETGLTRSKNNINVAMKNLIDFGLSTVLFWLFGFALMFGTTGGGWVGLSQFALSFDELSLSVFFLYQVMFCGTAVTILSGAVAERLRFNGYIFLTILVAGLTYPIFGHWAWNGIEVGASLGWLGAMGFVDFAGSTVVHSVGGWTALAVLLVIGARSGRFDENGKPRSILGANLPLAALGVLLLYIGWLGFNGGSTLALNDSVGLVLVNTLLAGSVGMVVTVLIGMQLRGRPDVGLVINGCLAGLVAITANAHAVTAVSAALIGAVGGLFMLGTEMLLLRFKIDDAVGAVPVHLGAGIWGTLAVGIFGRPELLGTGLGRGEQILVQLLGILVCFAWVFLTTYVIVRVFNRFYPLRVDLEAERIGLNVSEHGASTELLNLFTVMDSQARTGDLSLRAPVEPFTEVGQIAERYNQVMGRLEVAVARTSAIVSGAMDGIITFSPQSLAIKTINPAAESLFGISPAHAGGTSLAQLVELDAHQIQEAVRSRTRYELIGHHTSGKPVPVEATFSETAVGDTRILVGTFRNITQRKEAEQALIKARDDALSASRLKTQLLANISHDLRTPLNAILGYSEMLQEGVFGSISDKQQGAAGEIIDSTSQLLNFVNNLLNQAEIDAGKLTLNVGPFKPTELIESPQTVLALVANSKGLQLTYSLSPDVPETLYGDYYWLRQILLNLLSNAVKYTHSGSVHTSIEMNGHDTWMMRVSDTGYGIPTHEHNAIFEPFRRGADANDQDQLGTGVGLFIVKQLTDMMQGRIELESQVGQGSTFSVILPTMMPMKETT